MARVLVRLKLTILRRSLRGTRVLLFVLGLIYGLAGGIGSALLPLAASSTGLATDLTAAVVAVWALGWIVGPIVLGGGDETIRPENFALLPLSPTALARGMGAASLVGVAPVVTLVAFAAHLVAAGGAGPVAMLLAVLGALLELGFVVLCSRVVVAALSAVLATRRGRDLGVLLGALGALVSIPLQLVIRSIGPIIDAGGAQLAGPGAVLRALPTGWGALAVRGAAEGAPLLAAGPLLGLVALDGALLVLWGRLLRRRLTEAADTGGPRRGRRRSDGAAGGARTSGRGRGPLGTVLVRELRQWRRDARRRTGLVTALVLGLALPAFVDVGDTGGGLAYAALWVATLAATQFGNLYGMDGTATWHLLVVPGVARADVRGRQLAWVLVVAPVAVAAAVAGPLITGRPSAAVWVAGLTPLLLGAGAGLVVLQSTYLPFAMPQGRGAGAFSANGGASGAGCVRGLTALAFLLLLAVASLPVVALVLAGTLTGSTALAWAGVPVGLAVGAGLWWWWGDLARRRLVARGPEILAAVRAPG